MKQYILTLFSVVFLMLNSNAQVASYTFSQSSGSYTAISGGTLLVSGTTSMDSWVSSAITIPSFTINCVSYTTAYVTSNGQISLGGSAPSAYSYSGVSSGVGSGICICPFSADLDDATNAATSEIRWQTVGNEVIFQWTKMCRYGVTESFDFQARLNTVTGNIVFVYRLNSGPGASTSYQPEVGIRTSATDYNNRLVASGAENWSTSLVGASSSSTCRFTSAAPAKNFTTGLTYTFTNTLATCSGTPAGGTVSASPLTLCSGSATNLSVSGSASGCGITYQWQSSNDNISWNNISGATSATYSPIVTANTYYRRVTTCTNSGLSSNSTSVQITLNAPTSCYCTSSATSTSDMDVTNITFGTINNTSATVSLTGSQGVATGTAGMYSDWRGTAVPVPSVQQGQPVPISVTIGGTAYGHRVDVYIDFNHDGDLTDAGESFAVFAYANPTLPNTTAGTISIPTTALTGNTLMRIVCVEASSSSPCGTYTWGETEDYTINITAATSMVYNSCTTTQTVTTDVGKGSALQQIIGVQVVTTGAANPLTISSFTFNTTGTTLPSDITNARLWATGTSSTFATTTQLGSTVANPSGSYTINSGTNIPYTLSYGTNYFWLTYDISASAVVNDYVDAECTNIIIGGISRTPSVTAPAGRRQIKDLCVMGIGTGLVNIASLPYSVSGQTTTGMVNDLTSTTATVCGSSSYYDGLDVVYTFTPATSGNITITLTSAGTYTSLVLYDGCPVSGQGGSCVTYAQSSTGNKSICTSVTAGHKYYLLLDNYNTTAVTYDLSITAVSPGLANDDPCGATTLAVGTTCSYSASTNVCAGNSLSVPAPTCASYNGGDVWFKATVPADGAIIIDTQTGVITDGGMAVYTGPDCSNLTFLECDDDDSDNGSMPKITRSGLTPGSTIWIRVWEYGGDVTGTFSICASETKKCPAALGTGYTSIASLPYNQSSTTCGAVNDIASGDVASLCGSTSYYGGEDKVYSFTPATSGTVTLTLTSAGTYTGMMLYDGCVFSGNCVGYQQSSTGNKSMCVGVTAGHTYYLLLDYSTSGSCNTYTIDISAVAAGLANDDPCGATTLTVNSTCSYVNSTNACAGSTSLAAPACGSYSGGDVWFKATVPASGSIAFDTQTGVVLDGSMAVYSGSNCSTLTLVECDEDDSDNGTMPRIILHGRTPGETLWVRFWEAGNDNNGTFSICAYDPPSIPTCVTNPAAGDLCTSATPICNFNGYCGNTSAAYDADSPGNLSSEFCGSIDNNSWLSFVAEDATATLNIWVMNCTDGDGIQMEIYGTTDCNTFTSYSNCWNPGVMVDGTVTANGLTPGTTYYLMIDGWAGDVCDYIIGAGSGAGVLVPDAGLDQTVTPPTCATLSASGGTTYSWSSSPADPTLSVAEMSMQTINVCPTVQTTYTVTVTGGNPLCPSNGTDGVIVFINTGLPVQYLSMDAKCQGDEVRINWATASQENCDHFIVEKSLDGQSFSSIREITCHGTTSVTQYYSVKDDNITVPVNYYRIKQVDFDGKFSYTPVFVADCRNQVSQFEFSAYLQNNNVMVNFDAVKGQNYNITFTDAAGKKVYTELYYGGADDNVTVSIPASYFAAGSYMITVGSNMSSASKKLVID